MTTATQKFEISSLRHRFDSARDAIDAVSAFEASTLDEVAYAIEPHFEGWVAEVYSTSPRERLGNLMPARVEA